MKRREYNKIILIVMCMVITIMLSACGENKTKKDDSSDLGKSNNNKDMITVVDHNDNVVEVPKNIERVAVCDIWPLPSVLSVFFDSADKLVGIAPASMTAAENSLLGELYPEIKNAKTDFIDDSNVNVEELMKLNPDVVFYSASNKELGEQLTNAGFSAVAIAVNKWNYNAIETLNNWIKLLSEIFPENDKAQIVADYSEEKYNLVQTRVKDLSDEQRKKVFFLFKYTDSSIMTSGQQFFGEWWAEAVGAMNVAKELSADNSVEVNLEQIYNWNPEMIYITNFTTAQPNDIYNNTIGNYDWSEITAIKNKSVYKMPLGMYRSYTPGVDTPVTLLWFAKTTYPKLFEDIDIIDETRKYYEEVFGITLTDEQAQTIFEPTSDVAVGL